MHPSTRRRPVPCGAGFVPRGLLIAGLILVIAGAVISTVHICRSKDKEAEAIQEGMHFQCGKCGQQFTKTSKQLTLAELNTRPESLRTDCPLCGAKRAGIPTVECPSCGKQYPPASHTDPAAFRAGTARDVCPHCGTDRKKGWEQHYSKKRKR
jgi:predicted RNA-binding Zn-ribbon protein involved in translation (DUF1610 family)